MIYSSFKVTVMAEKKTKKVGMAFTDNERINDLLDNVVDYVKDFTQHQLEEIEKLTQIGLALSAEPDIDRLLEMIVDEARRFTGADGGTLYIVDDDEKELLFSIAQTDSLNVRMGGSAGKITWPPIRLYNEDGSPNYKNVSTYAALSGEMVNIDDVYNTEKFDFEGTRRFDSSTGYHSQSTLVVPMRNHENDIIGVLQLLNAMDSNTGEIIPFSPECQRLTESLASQAAVALTNNRLIRDLRLLLESFFKSIATAIDEKSPYTGNHGRRVVELTIYIAEKINSAKAGSFKDIFLDEHQMNELVMAAWLHDVGKIAVPEYVMDKSTKLESIYDRINLLKTRCEVIRRDIEIAHMRRGMESSESSSKAHDNNGSYEEELKSLQEDLNFIESVNMGSEFMSDEKIAQVKKIALRKWKRNGEERQLLTDEEVKNLCIRKGTLTEDEKNVINSHAALTYGILSQLPFPKKLRNVPYYASSHHEFINGTGYPKGLKGDDIPLQARILALADIFEALTAGDRPYRKGNTLSSAIKILEFMVKDDLLDKDLFDLFIKEEVYLNYAKKELDPSQIDEVNV
jgi:HD-GYP domain-containing protein (c-di-GMP phosphodiesterase class II)